MRVLVTGGAGFIGSYLIPKLLERGCEIGVFDIKEKPVLLDPVAARITYLRGDLGVADQVWGAVEKFQPKGIIHLGAMLAGVCEENLKRCFDVNFGSTQILLNACLKLGIEKFFMASSVSVFGRDVPEPVKDSAPKNPGNIYGQTKLASEHLMRWYRDQYGLDTRGIRPTIVFGPGRTTGITALYTSRILEMIASREPVLVSNPGQRGDWLYVRDVVRGILLIWDKPLGEQRIFNIAGSVHSTREVAELAKKFIPAAQITYADDQAENSTPYSIEFDDTPAREALGYRPEYTIELAVQDFLKTRKAI